MKLQKGDCLGKKEDITIGQFVIDCLNDRLDHDGGELERIAYKIDKIQEAVANLTELLIANKTLSEEDAFSKITSLEPYQDHEKQYWIDGKRMKS